MRSFCGALVSYRGTLPLVGNWLSLPLLCLSSLPILSLKGKAVPIFHKPRVTNGISFSTLASRELGAKLGLIEVDLKSWALGTLIFPVSWLFLPQFQQCYSFTSVTFTISPYTCFWALDCM